MRLPQLVDYLETARPDDSWPFELRLLRSQVRSGESEDRALELALERIARLPVLRIGGSVSTDGLGMGPVDQARMEIEQLVKSLGGEPDHAPSKSLVATSSHLAQLCLHVGDFFGSDVYHQWFVFDDHWASAHRDLAEGLLRYAKRWDALT